MNSRGMSFTKIVEAIYTLSIDDRLELQNLLERNIADARRNEIYENYKIASQEHKKGKLKFSSDIKALKKKFLFLQKTKLSKRYLLT
jgi:hypothetical protein